jgi:hypothetical protein
MNSPGDRRRPWWRSRRLLAAVIVVDLLGAGLLVFALTRPADRPHTPTVAQATVALARAGARPTASRASATVPATTITHPAAHRRRRRLRPATSMPKPSMSRAPALPAAAQKVRAAGGAALDANAAASFQRLRDAVGSDARIAVAAQPLGAGRMQVFGGSPAMPAMSTSKVLILSALLADRGGVSRLTAEQKALAQTAITESDNDSILALFADLEADRGGLDGASAYATGLLREAGDDHTTVATGPVPAGYATTFGQTPWTPAQEVTFFRALAAGCVLPGADVDYELSLMRQIEPSESWGLGSAGFPQIAFKGGWGPLPGGYGVRQTAIIGAGSRAVVVSIAADPATSFATGQLVLGQIARWVRSEISSITHPPAGCSH